jgi:hypothetical protein
MLVVRTLLRLAAIALLLAAGLLLLWPAPAAHACLPGWRIEDVPLSQVSPDQQRWAVAVGPDYLRVWWPDKLPKDAVVFEGTPVSTSRDPKSPGWQADGPQEWTFRVERVLQGDVPREVVVAGAEPGNSCYHLGPAYQLGVRQWVVAIRWDMDPRRGTLRGQKGRFAEVLPDHATGGAPRTISVVAPPASPPQRPVPQRPAALGGAALGTWLTLAFLAEIVILGLAALAGAVYLRARELDMEERQLALREREADRRS